MPVENSSDIYILSIYISVEPEAHATQIVGQMPVWKCGKRGEPDKKGYYTGYSN
jgi:hypothetical protein